MPKSKEEIIADIQSMQLITLVGGNQKVHACVTFSPSPYEFYIELKSIVDEKKCGYIRVRLEFERKINSFGQQHEPHLYIVDMRNQSGLKHVGNALHELAFRLSVAAELQGRIRLNAAWSSHLFHCLNGFLPEWIIPDDPEDGEAYYSKLKAQVIQAKSGKIVNEGLAKDKRMSPEDLYLPKKYIRENLTKFGLASEGIVAPDSDEKPCIAELTNLAFAEEIMTLRNSMLSRADLTPVSTCAKMPSLVPLLTKNCLIFRGPNAENDTHQKQAPAELAVFSAKVFMPPG